MARLDLADDALIAARRGATTRPSRGTWPHWQREPRDPAYPTRSGRGRELTQNRERSNYELNALATGFWSSGSLEDLRPYAARYVTDIPHLAQWVGADALDRVATLAFPARVVEPETVELVREAIARPDLTAGVRRSMADELSKLEEALASRARWA